MGWISVLVNWRGIATAEGVLGRAGPHTLESFERALAVNFSRSFNMVRLAAAEMAGNVPDADRERGVGVDTASIAAFDGQKGQAACAASKAGIAGMTLPLARDLASLGIRVNAIMPGVFLTPMLEALGSDVQLTLAADVSSLGAWSGPRNSGRWYAFASRCRI